MLKKYVDVLTCELCGSPLTFSGDSTVDEYAIYMSITPTNLNAKVEELINGYLVYDCTSCGNSHKFTSKEIERLMRKKLTERALLLLIRGLVEDTPPATSPDTYLIYCGKCQGFDGKGSCTKSIFDRCQIKRFPINEL